jgi:hypothetical protein
VLISGSFALLWKISVLVSPSSSFISAPDSPLLLHIGSMSDPKGRNRSKSGAKRNALKATQAPAIPNMRRSSRVRGEEGPALPVSQKRAIVVDLDATEDDALVYLGKRDKTASGSSSGSSASLR